MKKVNVCAYARVSTDSKDQENSYENQKNYFKREIEKNENYNLVEVYADRGLTATSTTRRVEFLRMIHDAGVDVDMYAYTHQEREQHQQVFTPSDREPNFSKIFVKNTSRFARNIDIIVLLRILRQKGVFVDFLDINKTTENESDFVFIEMLLVFDENDSRDKSRKVRFGQLEGMKNGVIHTNSKLYGYNLIDKYTLEIIPEEAEVIKTIFELYASGDGARIISQKLAKKGYKTRRGKNFGHTTILKILQNHKYKGDNVRNKYTTGTIFVDKTVTSQIRDKEDWIIHEDTIPPIVSDELWQKCKDMRLSKNVGARGIYKGKTKYVGIVKCGNCGENYHRNVDRGRHFYNCSTKKKYGVDVCGNININESEIDAEIERLSEGDFKQYMYIQSKLNISSLESIIERLNEKVKENVDNDELERYNLQLTENINKKNNLSDLYLSNRVTLEYFDDKNMELEKEHNDIQDKIKYLLGGKELVLQEIDKAHELIEKMDRVEIDDLDDEYTTDEILEEIDTITIIEDDGKPKLNIEYKIYNDMQDLMRKYVNELNV